MRRRSFLAASGGVLAVKGSLMAQEDISGGLAPETGDVDAHSHIWTDDVEKYPLAPGVKVEDLAPRTLTAEELLATANAVGVSRVVLIQHRPYHGTDNSYLTDCIAKYPGVFSLVACVDENAAGHLQEMERLKSLGARGFRIRPGEGGGGDWNDSRAITQMWEHAQKIDVAICPLINPQDLPMVDRMCERHAGTRVVVDHFARIGVDGEIREGDIDNLCRLARHPNTNVKISAFYALGNKRPPYDQLKPMIQRLLKDFGRERLMWASDSPYQMFPPNTYAASIGFIRNRCEFLTDEDKQWLLKKTAERVFFA